MATFYLLPPRATIHRAAQSFLRSLLPGVSCAGQAIADHIEDILIEMLRGHEDAFLVHQEDLADDAAAAVVLARDFGAQAGDEVIEIRPVIAGGWAETARWRLSLPLAA